jgi:hypothetical protein
MFRGKGEARVVEVSHDLAAVVDPGGEGAKASSPGTLNVLNVYSIPANAVSTAPKTTIANIANCTIPERFILRPPWRLGVIVSPSVYSGVPGSLGQWAKWAKKATD